MEDIDARDLSILPLGRRGENCARRIVFDISAWRKSFGRGTAQLLCRRPGDETPYPAPLEQEGGKAFWTVTATETARAEAYGQCQLQYVVGDAVVKTRTYQTWVAGSLAPEEEAVPQPQQGWVEQVLLAGAQALSGAEDAQAEADRAQAFSGQAEVSAQAAGKSALRAADAEAAAKDAGDSAARDAADAQKSGAAAAQALSDLQALVKQELVPLVDGKIPLRYIPAAATQEIYEITSEDALTGLTAQRGDLAELVETVEGQRTVTKTWQLLGENAARREDWVIWGASYAVRAAWASMAASAENAARVNHRRLVEMTAAEFDAAVKDEDTYYLVYEEAEE